MLKTTEFWTLTVLAVLAGVFAVVNMVLFQHARTAQIEVQAQQQFIQQTLPLEMLHRELVRVLAELSVRTQDAELRDMLTAHGVRLASHGASKPAVSAGPSNKGAK